MKKLANHIILSGVTVSMLFSPLMAINPNQLPSGGKFTHGTSGSININGNNMDIMGKGPNSVIQWGGGFSIGKDAQVNFGKGQSGQNYLNIAHGTSKSTIEGILNAGNNNVFLINPNGVIITKTGTINANRFVASTSSLQAKHFEEFKVQGASFSPVFNPQKAGNVVNMGNINANDVLLIGNKVNIDGGHINGKHNDGVSGDALKNPSGNTAEKIHLVGNYINLDLAKVNFNSKENLISADKSASVSISTENYYNQLKNNKNDPFKKYNFQKGSYGNVKSKDIEQFASIGSDRDWFFFAKSWNEDDTFKLVDKGVAEYRLIKDIEFYGNQGKNYADYCIEGLGCTNMIVGSGKKIENMYDVYKYFSKTFNGQGFTLKNINIDTKYELDQTSIGLFGAANGATFKNVNVDYDGGIKILLNSAIAGSRKYIGSFIGFTKNSTFENIKVSNVKNFKTYDPNGSWTNAKIGGFVGSVSNSKFSNIALYDFLNIDLQDLAAVTDIGGFVGYLSGNVDFNNVSLKKFGSIKAKHTFGGFVGSSYLDGNYKYNNISLEGFKDIQTTGVLGAFGGELKGKMSVYNVYIDLNGGNLKSEYSNVGGFAGYIAGNGNFQNIHIKNIGKIQAGVAGSYVLGVGGFAGYIDSFLKFNNIVLDNIKEISADKGHVGGFAGKVENADFSNISINNIGRISSNQDGTGVGGFIGFIDATNGDVNIGFKDIALNFNSKGLIQGGDIGGFIGNINNQAPYTGEYYRTNLNFSNIHIYFDPNFSIQYNGMGKGKFIGYYDQNYNTFNFKNKVNFYANDNIFNGATTDKSLWNHFTTLSPNENVFKNNTENITEAINVSVISPEFTRPEKIPDDVEVKLDMDDLYSDVIDSIIKDITNEYFSINIHDLIKILNEYKYENMNEDQKVEFIKTYFINKSKYDKNTDLDKIARSVVQSLDFASVYQGNFSEGKLNASALKEYKNNLAPKTQKIKDDQDSLNSFLKNEKNGLKWLVGSTNDLLEKLK
ncbi:filamentous hemagglutinin N-terminal domain-containing protein, partial [Campylobacter lari]|nr:filamentous hemagglutinin N-terminal domain-containing protein [Campylobacter lari]